MTIYREVVVTKEQRDILAELGTDLTRAELGKYASTVRDVVERWDESVASESTFPVSLNRYIDELVIV